MIAELNSVLQAAIGAVNPYRLVKERITGDRDMLHVPGLSPVNLNEVKRIYLAGIGKAVAPMARAMEEILADRLEDGLVVVKYGHLDKLKTTQLMESGHPVPDAASLQAGQSLWDYLQPAARDDLVILLISGGGSALVEKLPETITLDHLQEMNRQLLACGAGIHEINCIRRHVSLLKGGQLARVIYPARTISLILSDVIGDDLSVIASGITAPDDTGFSDALEIIRQHNLKESMPQEICEWLQNGNAGYMPDTPGSRDPLFDRVRNVILGNNRLALDAAARAASAAGYHVEIVSNSIAGEARDVAVEIARQISEKQNHGEPVCLLFGGEPTVTLRGNGKGGRNQELALAVALQQPTGEYLFASCGSDGTDGPTNAAGAWVNHLTLQRAEELGLNAGKALENNNAWPFFKSLDQLLVTGPTNTNVMDIMVALIKGNSGKQSG
jgi:glycerate 2-kinase